MKKIGRKEMNKYSYKEEIKRAIDIIKESENIFIASHINPDGDNLGSILSMYLALKNIGKNVYPLKADILPEDFLFLPGSSDIVDYSLDLGSIDLLITVDSSDEDRLGDNKELLKKAGKTINIDHHATNTFFADVNIVDEKSPATGQLIYEILKEMDLDITKDIATNIYTAINTDTGKFSYSNVTSKTHRIAADLIDSGVDVSEVDIKLYQSMTMEQMRLFKESITSLKTFNNDQIALIRVSQHMLEKTGASMEDSNGLVEFIRQIKSVEVAGLLKENIKDEIKVSLRSKEFVDVSEICKAFGGGGHIRASGCTINKSLNQAEKALLKEIEQHLRKEES